MSEQLIATRYAGFWIRAAAYLIDLIVLQAGSMVLSLPALFLDESKVVGAILGLVIFIACIVYYVGFMGSRWQATPGKRIVGIYVQRKDGGAISYARAFARFFVPLVWLLLMLLVAGFIGGVAMSVLYNAEQAKSFLVVIVAFGWFIGTISIYLPVAFTKQKTGLHDMIASTRVVYGKTQ